MHINEFPSEILVDILLKGCQLFPFDSPIRLNPKRRKAVKTVPQQFAAFASGVCKAWRDLANDHEVLRVLPVDLSSGPSYAREVILAYQAHLEQNKACLIDIWIDDGYWHYPTPSETNIDLAQVLPILVANVGRWRSLSILSNGRDLKKAFLNHPDVLSLSSKPDAVPFSEASPMIALRHLSIGFGCHKDMAQVSKWDLSLVTNLVLLPEYMHTCDNIRTREQFDLHFPALSTLTLQSTIGSYTKFIPRLKAPKLHTLIFRRTGSAAITELSSLFGDHPMGLNLQITTLAFRQVNFMNESSAKLFTTFPYVMDFTLSPIHRIHAAWNVLAAHGDALYLPHLRNLTLRLDGDTFLKPSIMDFLKERPLIERLSLVLDGEYQPSMPSDDQIAELETRMTLLITRNAFDEENPKRRVML